MRPWITFVVAACLSATNALAQAKSETGRTITLTSSMGELVVPAGRIWKIAGAPTTAEGIGTADLHVDGTLLVGPNKNLTLIGYLDLSFTSEQTFPIWIRGGATVKVGDSRPTLVVTELPLTPWNTPVPPLESLHALGRHIGEYPCSTGLLGAPVLQSAIKAALADDYGAYLEHIALSGCGAIERRGSYLLMDVSQLHVGGYTSIILVSEVDDRVFVLWLKTTVAEGDLKLYGNGPMEPSALDEFSRAMNVAWGGVACFVPQGDTLRIDTAHRADQDTGECSGK